MLLKEKLRDYISANFPLVKKIYNKSLGAKRYKYLFTNIRDNKSRKIMEIGTWDGLRAEEMIKVAKKIHGNKVEYYGFDLFEGLNDIIYEKEVSKKPPSLAGVKKRLEKIDCSVNLYKGDTLKVLPEVIEQLPKMDFIFIDGGHSLETIDNDWRHAKKLMSVNTVVIFDDYWEDRNDAGCKKIIEAIDRNKYNVEILPIQDKFKKDWGILKINFVKVTLKH